MKKTFLILLFFYLTINIFSQEKKTFPFNELSVSINRTVLKDNNTNDGFCFGIATYHNFLSEKRANLILGIEYNRTSQFKKIIYESHFSNSSDLKYFINSLSIPFNLRVIFGNKVKFFLGTGIFVDLNIGAKRNGTMHTYLPNQNNQIEYKEFEFEEKVRISAVNYGFSIGVGIHVPISKFRLIINPEYKYGVNELYDGRNELFNKYIRIMLGIKI